LVVDAAQALGLLHGRAVIDGTFGEGREFVAGRLPLALVMLAAQAVRLDVCAIAIVGDAAAVGDALLGWQGPVIAVP
jgi:hypothetical protein